MMRLGDAVRARGSVVAAIVLIVSTHPVTAGERVEVVDLAVSAAEDSARVSYRLEGTMPDEVIERLQAGIAVTFSHRVDLVTRRGFFLAPSRLMHRCEIETTATYDSLTKQYGLERTTRHRPFGGEETSVVVDRDGTDRVEVVRAWMTEVADVAVPLEALDVDQRAKSRIRVFSVIGRRYVLLVFPSTVTAAAEAGLSS